MNSLNLNIIHKGCPTKIKRKKNTPLLDVWTLKFEVREVRSIWVSSLRLTILIESSSEFFPSSASSKCSFKEIGNQSSRDSSVIISGSISVKDSNLAKQVLTRVSPIAIIMSVMSSLRYCRPLCSELIWPGLVQLGLHNREVSDKK